MDAILVPIALVLLLLALGQAIYVVSAFLGGWHQLQKLYPDQPASPEVNVSGLSLCFGRSAVYGQVIRVELGQLGIRISISPFLRLYHPPIFVPWKDVAGCELTHFRIFKNAVRLEIAQWPHPIHIYSLLWKHEKFPALLLRRWEQQGAPVAQP
ncbi:MAG: hypothetical protein EOP84_12490 [Verrucomicrobiaceae bacterium]|nr:MAG: hypothetical protein EOP84_12490 [Verrucomicrobiaceae bacterium]